MADGDVRVDLAACLLLVERTRWLRVVWGRSRVDTRAVTEVMQISQRPQTVMPGEQQRLNAMALTAFVVVFFASVVGLVLGYVALHQVERTQEAGRGFALAAVILGWIGTIGVLLIAVALFVGSWVFRIF